MLTVADIMTEVVSNHSQCWLPVADAQLLSWPASPEYRSTAMSRAAVKKTGMPLLGPW